MYGEQPLLQWETFGPIVRAAASVHPQSIPLAVAAMGTELAAAAVNVVPVEDFGGARVSQDQGVLVLSASLRLVGQADRRSHNAPCNAIISDGLYSQWMHSCFGATAAIVVESGSAQKIDDVAVEPSLPPGRSEQAAKDSHVAQTHRPEVREI